jgi:hypothetical protein
LARGQFIDAGERFVHQDQVGFDGQGARQSDTLALAAGKIQRKLIDVLLEADHL